MLRSLTHHWRVNLAVTLAVAVCAAVLTGALLVGDSVRASLRDLTLDRLGHIDTSLVAERFFRADLVDELAALPDFTAGFERVAGAILLRGNAVHADTRARASQVNVFGIDDAFIELFDEPTTSAVFQSQASDRQPAMSFARSSGQLFPSIVINASLQRELGAVLGDQLLVRFRLGSEVPRDTLLGSREAEDVVGTIRTSLVEVVPDRGIGRFDLNPHQASPLNAFLSLNDLQAAVEQPGRVNSLLLDRRGDSDADPQPLLVTSLSLADIGLGLSAIEGPANTTLIEIESEEFVLRPGLVETIEAAARDLRAPTQRLQVYMSNSLRIADRQVPYSMVLALDVLDDSMPFGRLNLLDGTPAPALGADEILLNEWTATELGASTGDELRMSYYVVGLDEQLRTEETRFRMAGTVAMRGLAVDADLTPEYPGIEGIDNIADWEPPFPVDLSVIRDVDEEYWDAYRGTPKSFVAADTGRRLWSTRYGATTAVRVAVPAGVDPATFSFELGSILLERLEPQDYGFRFVDIKSQGLEAAAGATDFGQLFLAFSFFLILSALMIVSLLFTLGIEQRGKEIGLLLAVGYPLRQVRQKFLAEGAAIAALGGVAGLVAAVLYGKLMLWGLRTIWLAAVGSPLLYLHVLPATLVIGFAISSFAVVGSIWITVRRLRRLPPTRLLAGVTRMPAATVGQRRRRGWLAPLCFAAAIGLLAYALAGDQASNPGIAFGIGALLLTAGLAAFATWCRRARGRVRSSSFAAISMAIRNSSWSPNRSILSVALVASACFVIVTVAGNTRDPAREAHVIEEGAGGYDLIAMADVPIHQNLNDVAGRFDLGFDATAEARLKDVRITQLRLVPGDDASCLNLYQPRRPRLLGATDELIDQGGFRFAALSAELEASPNPWELLRADLGPGVIPAIGDANSMQWILKLPVDGELIIEGERGEELRLRLVGTVQDSIFQSELLISEANLLRYFPGRSGFSYFLIDAPAGRDVEVAASLEDRLERFGFDATRTADRIAGFLVVQNTYLSTFQALGGLGLLLGTIGLGVVLVRNVIERRGELATLRAFGFRRAFLARMVLAENAFLLAIGTLIGSASALLAIAPRFALAAVELPWGALLPTLAAVLVVGMLASLVAVIGALRVPLLPALKAER